MRQRNKAVLLEHGRQEVGSRIEREFERVAAMVRRDLQGYPTLQRKLLDEITRIEEDYRKCGEVPPPPPDWVEAVAAVANVKSGSEMVQTILEEIKRSVDKMHEKTLGEYRRSYETRHKILEGFMPFWRSVDKTLTAVDKKLAELQNGASAVDAQMEKYEAINAKTDKAEQMLTVSAFTQFAIALLVMLVAAGGAFINFKLIALPMSEMVGAGDYLTSSLRTSEVAALVIILVEASMGLFLMEALRITHLFPRIASLSEHLRRRMMWIALVLLVTLAGVEAALALMRDMLIADKQALLQSLATAAPSGGERGLGGTHPDRRPDAAGLHPAVRARLHRGAARIADPFEPHGRRGAACRAGRRAGAGVARRLECRAAPGAGADHRLRRGDRPAASRRSVMRKPALRRGAGERADAAALSTSTIPRIRFVEYGGHHDPMRCLLLLLSASLAACGDARNHAQAVYVLVDTSGTFAQEATKAQVIVNYLLGTLQPGDSLAVARVESRSFTEKDIVAKATFDIRPSQANAQKRAFRDTTERFRQEREVEPLHRHHRRAAAGRRVPERDRRRHQDPDHLLRHAGGAGQDHGARHPDEPEEHPRGRGQRGEAQDRQHRSAALLRAAGGLAEARARPPARPSGW